MIWDQIVFRVDDSKIRERLLRETELTLAGAIKIYQASELSHKHVKTFNKMAAVVSAQVSDGATAVSNQRKRRIQTRPTQKTLEFRRCGSQHKPKQGPAFGNQCSSCKPLFPVSPPTPAAEECPLLICIHQKHF